jgi:hypothetical protein
MLNEIIYVAIELIILIAGFLLGKFVVPKILNNKTIVTLSTWVYKFVISAKNQFEDGQGELKREYVTKAVQDLCKKININLTDEQIRALIEDAYTSMKAGEKEANSNEENN